MTQDSSSQPKPAKTSEASSKEVAQSDATGNWIAAWPTEPQQLFLLLPSEPAGADDWKALAHNLTQHFAQGAVAVLVGPAEIALSASHQPTTVESLRQLVQQWQARAGLDFARTAIIAQGTAASLAMQVVMQHEDICARLFAISGHLPEQATPIAEHTCLHWLHVRDGATPSAEQAREWGQRLQALDVDFTLDVLESQAASACVPELQQRILYLLQNHVPRRLWREALASAEALDAAAQAQGNDEPTLH